MQILLAACTMGIHLTSAAVELEKLFSDQSPAEAPPPARDIVRAAFDGLFDLDVAMFVEAVTTQRDGAPTEVRFWLYRKRYPEDSTKVFLALLEPNGEPGMRLLQVDRGQARRRAWIYSPGVSRDPVRTEYRLTDPFLGTLSDREPEEVRADLYALSRGYEIRSFETVPIGDGEAYRIGLRSLETRSYERAELLVAKEIPAILQYRFYELGQSGPARTIIAPRADLVRVGDRWLPGRLVYSDRLLDTTTELQIRYLPLPEDVGDAPFVEVSFHEVAVPRAGDEQEATDSLTRSSGDRRTPDQNTRRTSIP